MRQRSQRRARVDVAAHVISSIDPARPDVIDATASASSRNNAVDAMSEAGMAISVRMQQPIRIRESFIDEALQRLACCSSMPIISAEGEPIEESQRLVEISQHDDLLHSVRPAQKLCIQLVSQRDGW